jgi:hypothetical protein
MLIRIGYELQFDLTAATHMVLMLHTHPERAHLLQRPERLHVEPQVNLDTFIDTFGNRGARIMAPAGQAELWYDNVNPRQRRARTEDRRASAAPGSMSCPTISFAISWAAATAKSIASARWRGICSARRRRRTSACRR